MRANKNNPFWIKIIRLVWVGGGTTYFVLWWKVSNQFANRSQVMLWLTAPPWSFGSKSNYLTCFQKVLMNPNWKTALVCPHTCTDGCKWITGFYRQNVLIFYPSLMRPHFTEISGGFPLNAVWTFCSTQFQLYCPLREICFAGRYNKT